MKPDLARYWNGKEGRWIYPEWWTQYKNDVPGYGDYLCNEWWEITNGTRTFTAYDKEEAEWLCTFLNEAALPLSLQQEE